MIAIRPGNERGYFDYGWLQTYHTFSFSSYYDPRYMGFRDLRVINQDTVASGQGFATHSHHDMEIITYVLSGTITHQDSMGNKTEIHAGEIQCMTAGTGVRHSEYNLSANESLELLQIWILPNADGLTPSYQQKTLQKMPSQFRLMISPDKQQDSLLIHQDVRLYNVTLAAKETRQFKIADQRHAWLQLISGKINLNNQILFPGDGVAISDEREITVTGVQACEFLWFDLN